MNNDLKTTVTGVVGGILTIVSILWKPIPNTEVITSVIVGITLVVLGYLTNKKDKPEA